MNGTLSDFLNLLEVRGQSWCFLDIRSMGGFSMPANDAALFYAVVHGSVQITGITGGTIQLTPGNVAMILSGEAHALRVAPEGPTPRLDFLCDEQSVDAPPVITLGEGQIAARMLCARLRVGWPNGLLRAAMPPVVFMYSRNSDARAAMMPEVGVGPGSAATLTRLAALMLTASLRNHPQCQLLFKSAEWSDPIAHALHLIGTDPTAEWSVSRLASRVGMRRSSFAGRFTAQVGRTPMEVITERRMQYAAGLLQQSEMKIVEICARVGYRSQAAFSRRFTRHFGVSPSSLRDNVQTGNEPESIITTIDSRQTGDQRQRGA